MSARQRRAACRATRRSAELTRRYFTSHGPATLRDYVWWSGLTMKDVRRGVEIAGRALVQETFGELTYWSAAPAPRSPAVALAKAGRASSAYLLPIYDEYLIAYKDRGAAAEIPPTRPSADHRRLRALAHRRWPVQRDVETRRDPGRRRGQPDAPPIADGSREEGGCGCRSTVRRVSRDARRRARACRRHAMKARWAWLFVALLASLALDGGPADRRPHGPQ